MRQEGFLLISDISGYTAFLTQSELEHATGILEDLFQTLLDQIRLPLVIAKLEGDAIFAYARQGSVLDGQTLLEGVEYLYASFANKRDLMQANTTCTCTACTLIPTLDLKFFIHYGEFVVGKGGELSGPDVILIHRLLKNEVVETMGVKAYALFTDAAIEHMGVQAAAEESMQPHSELYEHIGEVPGYVHDLHPVWERRKEMARIEVRPEDAWVSLAWEVPIPPALAWDYMADPERKRVITGMEGLFVTGMGARRGVGMIHHCAHGDRSNPEQFVDWRPFEYTTQESTIPPGVRFLTTIVYTPTEQGTRIEFRMGKPYGKGLLGGLAAAIMGPIIRRLAQPGFEKVPVIMRRFIDEDVASGRLPAPVEPALPAPVEPALAGA